MIDFVTFDLNADGPSMLNGNSPPRNLLALGRQLRSKRRTFGCWLIGVAIVICLGGATPIDAQSPTPKLKYNWQTDQPIGYEFDLEFELDGKPQKSSGFVNYKLKHSDVTKDLDGNAMGTSEFGESSSTAFAVAPNGYLLTCAHCVDGATEITVQFGEKKLVAKIVEADFDLDLAILKIDATDLPVVRLGKDRSVELAQDVRAIGFPLSDVLGDSVKISQGSIAGFVRSEEATIIQVDVAVNPGNSGGPLVDANGNVIGVVNAKLNGEQISRIGFAVPIQAATEMLDRHNIQYDATESTKSLSGPEIARKITPAVFFVKAEIGPGGKSPTRNFQFTANGSYRRPDANGRSRQIIAQDQMIMDRQGTLIDSRDETPLPLLMGTISEMPFEKLPKHVTQRWTQAETLILPLPASAPATQQAARSPFDPFFRDGGRPGLDGLGRLGLDPFRGFGIGPRFGFDPNLRRPEAAAKTEMRLATAHQTTEYKIIKTEGKLATIESKFSLKTIDDDQEFCNLRLEHTSTLQFDMERGIFIAKELSGRLKLKMGEDEWSTPVKFKYRQVDLQTFLNPDSNRPSAQPPKITDGLSDQQLTNFIDDPLQFETHELLGILNRLSKWNAAESKKQAVVNSIRMVLEQKNPRTQKSAIEALLKWDPSEATPFVVAAFERANSFSQRSWIVKLGRTGHPDAAVVLVGQLANARLRSSANRALIELGAPAEPAVLAELQSQSANEKIANACLQILGKIGGVDSIEKIESLSVQPGWKSRPIAKTTIAEIRKRIDE